MRALLATLPLLLIAAPAGTQTGPQSMTVAAFMECLKDAVSGGDVDQGDGIVAFSCSAAKAKVLYNFLGRKIKAEIVNDRNGKFENRQFAGSACYHRIADDAGKTVDDFRCDLILAVGDALQD